VSVIKRAIGGNSNMMLAKWLPLIFATMYWTGNSFSQGAGCDEGVIRMPDRNGTIQICSSLAKQVPELSKQLQNIAKAMGDEKSQIAELTRLVKSMNNVSRGIGTDRQGEMLKNLSSQISYSESKGPEYSRKALDNLSDSFEDLQNQMMKSISNPGGAEALSNALKGPVGESIAKLELNNASRQLNEINVRLGKIEGKIDRIDTKIDALMGGDKNGLITNPINISQKYNNARVLSQRGEVDNALKLYEQMLDEKIIYADPIMDMILLAKKAYGSSGAKDYIQKTFSRIKNRPEYYFALEQVGDQPVDGAWDVVLKNSDSFPPLIDAYFNNYEKYCMQKYPPISDKRFSVCREEILKLEKIDSIILNLDSKKKSGEYSNFFLDSYKAKDYSENMWNAIYLQSLRNSKERREDNIKRVAEQALESEKLIAEVKATQAANRKSMEKSMAEVKKKIDPNGIHDKYRALVSESESLYRCSHGNKYAFHKDGIKIFNYREEDITNKYSNIRIDKKMVYFTAKATSGIGDVNYVLDTNELILTQVVENPTPQSQYFMEEKCKRVK
jgi:hypothetical protein